MRYEFIYKNKGIHSVDKMCTCIKVSRNAYYNWEMNKNSTSTKEERVFFLKDKIKKIFYDNREIYGSYRIQKVLEKEGLLYARSYIARLMRMMELRSVLRRKYIVTTDSNHAFPIASNVLNRVFSTLKLGEKWVSDITYIRVNDNWNYLTTIIDLADRKVVGWSLSKDMTTENTVMKAWNTARNNRNIIDGFVFHSDRGVQYASNKITKLFTFNKKVTQSMSRKGNCWDNAVAESFFKSIKHEWLYRFKFTSFEQLSQSINGYINWYNRERLHSYLGYISPLEMEQKLRNKNKIAA